MQLGVADKLLKAVTDAQGEKAAWSTIEELETMHWADVVAIGMRLPGVEAGTSYGRPALKLRGKAIAVAGKEPDHFVLMIAMDEVDVLIETEPQVFFQTDHYKGWPAILARYETANPARIAVLLERAWTQRASKAQRTALAAGRD